MDQVSILQQLREQDRDAYIATLFVPEDKREAVAALYSLSVELDRIRDLISEPLPGEIRLQWWRDVLTGLRNEEGRQHPLGAVLLDAIERYALPAQVFDAMCEARLFDLYDDPMPSASDLEGYLGETRSVIFQLIAQILGGSAPEKGDAAGHAGIALGTAQLLRKMAVYRARNQIFVPKEWLLASEMVPQMFLALDDASQADATVLEMVKFGRDHLAKAEAAITELPQEQRAAFVILGVCAPVFKRAEKRRGAIALEPFGISPFTAQWYMTRYAAKL